MSAAQVGRRDLELSLGLMALIVGLAVAGLAIDGNWPKILRVTLSFLTYATTLLAWLRSRRSPADARVRLPFSCFGTAGAAAGIVSGLVRPEFDAAVLVSGTLGAAFLLGGVHWMALAHWRVIRAAIIARAKA